MNTEEWRAKAVKMFNGGSSYNLIAKELMLARSTVTKYLQGMGCYRDVPDKVLDANSRTANTLKKKAKKYTCKHCGVNFGWRPGENSHQYCSRECAFKAKEKKCVVCGAGIKGSSSIYCEGCREKDFQCKVCGKTIKSVWYKAYCSDDCRKENGRRQWAITKHTQREFTCKECGKTHTPSYGDKSRVYCSLLCARAAGRRVGKATRRARVRGVACEAVDPWYILCRDGWRCMLCGVKTPMKYRGTTHDRAPEVDHIQSLANGGTHTKDNLQCLCRKCNIEKGAETFGQARLCW